MKKTAFVILCITLLVFCADIGYWVHQRWWKNGLTVSIIDVGQGNAALLEMPGGECAMIDGGGFSDNDVFDMGEKVIAPFLWRKKIATIDTVFLTHYHSDHLNGLLYILKYFHVGQVFANHDPDGASKNVAFENIIAMRKIKYPAFETFDKHFEISGVRFDIVYPPENYTTHNPIEAWRNSNNNSMVIRVCFDDQCILFPGDIMEPAERELTASNSDLTAAILVSPHHGSRSSDSSELLARTHPDIGIISVGSQNRFGLPSPGVLSHYEEKRMTVFRTDINGCIRISMDGNQLALSPVIGKDLEIVK